MPARLFSRTLEALLARASGADADAVLEPLALGLLAGGNIVIGATRDRLAAAGQIARALADVVEPQAGPAFTLTEAISRRHTSSSLTGNVAFTWAGTDLRVPSAIPLDARMIIVEDLTRVTTGALQALEFGWLGQEDHGVWAEREFRRGRGETVKLSGLLSVLAIVDVDRPLCPRGEPFSTRFAHYFDIGVSLGDLGSAGPGRRERVAASRGAGDDVSTIGAAEIADFRAAAKGVELPPPDDERAELFDRAIERMDGVGFMGPFRRTRDLAKACAAGQGRDLADQGDWQRAITLRECAYAALYHRRPQL